MMSRVMISLSWMLVFSWMVLIFMLSSQPVDQSSKLSEGITEFITGTASTDDAQFERLNHLVRKNAHFFNYLILGILVMNAMRKSRMSGYKAIAIACGLCAIFAVSDEVHQLFVPGRGAAANDVLIDCTGALLGIGLYGWIARWRVR